MSTEQVHVCSSFLASVSGFFLWPFAMELQKCTICLDFCHTREKNILQKNEIKFSLRICPGCNVSPPPLGVNSLPRHTLLTWSILPSFGVSIWAPSRFWHIFKDHFIFPFSMYDSGIDDCPRRKTRCRLRSCKLNQERQKIN